MLKKTALFFITLITSTLFLHLNLSSSVSALEPGDIVLEVRPAELEMDLVPGASYTGSITVRNGGRLPFTINLSVLPYQVFNENYDPDFSTENSYTNLKNWISFPTNNISIQPGEEVEATFNINVPRNIPGGGQYAAIIIQTRDSIEENSSMKVISQIASLLYAHVEGEEHIGAVLMGHKMPMFRFGSPITASATIKNDGNIDFRAVHTMTIYDFFTNKEVLTPESKTPDGKTPGSATPIILPDTTRTNTLSWDGAPKLGVFRVVQHVSFLDEDYTFEKIIICCPIWLIAGALFIIVLFILWIVLLIHGRKGRRLQVM